MSAIDESLVTAENACRELRLERPHHAAVRLVVMTEEVQDAMEEEDFDLRD
jgi:hypothetical protein